MVENLWMHAPFARQDLSDLREVVFGITVTSIEDYVEDFRVGGSSDVEAIDLMIDWAPYAAARLNA